MQVAMPVALRALLPDKIRTASAGDYPAIAVLGYAAAELDKEPFDDAEFQRLRAEHITSIAAEEA